MKLTLTACAAMTMLTLSACQETPTETAKDVAAANETAIEQSQAARQEANTEKANAQADVVDAKMQETVVDDKAIKKITQAESEAMVVTANANYDVAMTDAKGRFNVANEKCDALKGVGEDACRSTINATLTADEAAITATRDAALVAATYPQQ